MCKVLRRLFWLALLGGAGYGAWMSYQRQGGAAEAPQEEAEVEAPPAKSTAAVISRIKIMSNLNIAEKRLPQDGRIDYQIGNKQLDMRVSTLPGVHGESVVLRILDRSDTSVPLEDLGMPERVRLQYEEIITQPNGMVLITGPTGSGKTTTLHSALAHINKPETKIWTAEDPVEITQAGLVPLLVGGTMLYFRALQYGLSNLPRADPESETAAGG